MEEKNKRNVEDIVSKLRHPAVITDRKTLKPNKTFDSLPVSAFYQKSNEHNQATNSLKACSLLSLVDKCDTDEKGGKIIYKNFNFDEVKDSSTQTSKTIIQLAKLEAGEMSPDSLSPTPRNHRQDHYNSSFEHFPLEEPSNDCGPLHFSRKNNIVQYLQSLEEPNIVENKSPCHQIGPTLVGEYPRKSLIETYLEKSRNRMNATLVRSRDSISGDMVKYIQPTQSPNVAIDEEPISISPTHNFKSQSLVDDYHQSCLSPHGDRVQPQYTRFTVKNVRERNHVNIMYRDTFYERTKAKLRTKRSNTFMLPTLASEQKSKIGEVRAIKKLISPIRRGRSSSPNPISNKVEVFPVEPIRIPYVDQSTSEIFSRKTSPQKERKSLIESAKLRQKIAPVLPPSDFERDMLRIDQMSLTLLPSDDSISERTRATDAISLGSSEISLNDLLNRIQDMDWNVSLKALAEATELCRTADADLMMPHMITINQRLIELLRSPRSHVCRTACQAAGHLFESMKDTRGPEFNDIVDILLGKTADANKFIRQDANLALDCMVTHISTFHAIRALCAKGPTHKNHLVRCATVRLIICAVVIAGPDVILNPASNEHTRKRIFSNMIKFLEDKNLETRKYGERLYKVLSKEPTFDQYLRKYMDKEDLTRMRKTLKFLQGRK